MKNDKEKRITRNQLKVKSHDKENNILNKLSTYPLNKRSCQAKLKT